MIDPEAYMVERCLKLVQKFEWIVDAFVIEFFSQHIWEQVPASWRSCLEACSPSDLANLLDYENKSTTRVWPLQLMALRVAVRDLAVPRIPISKRRLKQLVGIKTNPSDFCDEWKSYRDELSEAAGQHKHLEHVFRKHVKPKKQHEIARLSDVIRTVSFGRVLNLVDVGSGLGHLSRLLSFGHGFKVTCVDYSSNLSKTANKFDSELRAATAKAGKNLPQRNIHNSLPYLTEVSSEPCCDRNENDGKNSKSGGTVADAVSKSDRNTMASGKKSSLQLEQDENLATSPSAEDDTLNGDLNQGPRHITIRIDNALDSKTFEDAMFGECIPNFGIIGLHTCGDLGPDLVRLFSQCDGAKLLISVGCCYMKLDKCFPINIDAFGSRAENDQPVLSYSARELACHAVESFVDRLSNAAEVEKLKVHCRRAVLEDLIVSQWPEKRRSALRSVSNSHAISFQEYALRATSDLGIALDETILASAEVNQKLACWKQVLAFYALRLLLAPVVEHLILLDRKLSLRRAGFQSWILPVFDPKLSPRNHVLIALK